MSKRTKKINQRIDGLAEVRSKFNLRTNDNFLPQTMNYRRPSTHSYVPESEVIGRKADTKRIIKLLITQETRTDVSVLPIVGMGGLGKTTLLQKVYNNKMVTDHFDLRMWVSVPDDFSVEKIVKTMIENATSSKCKLSDLDSLQRRLSQVINGKRYLLALDDVWNEDRQKWEALRVLLTFGACGSTVVVTTRSGNVSSIVHTLADYILAGLSDDDCWTLFKRKAFVGGAKEDPSLVEIGRLIVKKCGGLPLAVMALGSLMPQFKGDETKWKMVMESDLWNSPVGRDEILPALRLSYHHLPPHLKQCFAFCAIFSRGNLISKNDLIDIWMANEFIPSDDKGIESELGGEAVFNDLEQRCFFQITSTSSYIFFKMHDLIHDLSKSIMGSKCSYLNKWEDHSTRKIRHMIIDPTYVLPVSTNFLSSLEDKRTPFGTSETMRTLLINNTEWRSSIPPNINYLRALCLELCETSMFPISICKLRHLRYLDLCNSKFKTLPEAISMLVNLQTLDLRQCRELRRLPNSLRLMRSLMHLYLDGCDSLECMPSRMGVLKRLRKVTRYVVGSEVGSGRIIDLKQWNLHDKLKLVGLENVRSTSDAEEVRLGSKENLCALELEWRKGSTGGIMDEEVLQALQPHQNLKKLTIKNYRGKKMPTWLLGDSMLLKNLVELNLVGLWRCEHLPQVGQLPSLQVLVISGMDSVTQVGGGEFYGTISSVVFPRLHTIQLIDIPALEEWLAVEGRPSFPKVTRVTIIGCPKLKTMPTFPSAQKLVIGDCPLLSPARDSFACMRSLETLWMGGECEKLIMMLEQEEELLLDSVSYLRIYELQLTSSSQLWKRFPSLQWLNIRLCSGLEGFHPEELLPLTALKGLELIDNPQLAVLPELPESVVVVRIKDCGGLVSLPEGMGRLPALKSLDLRDLPMLRTSLLDGYKSLKRLWIKGCPGVESSLELLTLQRPSLQIFTDGWDTVR